VKIYIFPHRNLENIIYVQTVQRRLMRRRRRKGRKRGKERGRKR
jgi:hypothetical protein